MAQIPSEYCACLLDHCTPRSTSGLLSFPRVPAAITSCLLESSLGMCNKYNRPSLIGSSPELDTRERQPIFQVDLELKDALLTSHKSVTTLAIIPQLQTQRKKNIQPSPIPTPPDPRRPNPKLPHDIRQRLRPASSQRTRPLRHQHLQPRPRHPISIRINIPRSSSRHEHHLRQPHIMLTDSIRQLIRRSTRPRCCTRSTEPRWI